jgi:hypothetical protein
MASDRAWGELLAEVELFIRFAVPPADQAEACRVAATYRDDPLALRLLREHYGALPEASEEAVVRVVKIASSQGVQLVAVVTTASAFLYALSVDAVVYLGPYGSALDEELLHFFGFKDQESYLAEGLDLEKLEGWADEEVKGPLLCPLCGVAEGEEHLLGCSLEICPWCEGQLRHCSCRFSQLQTEEITSDEQLDLFAELLAAKGRIPFTAEQLPRYPGTSEGLDRPKNRPAGKDRQ